MGIDQVLAKADPIGILSHAARDPLKVDVIVMNGPVVLHRQDISDMYLSNLEAREWRFEWTFRHRGPGWSLRLS